jgi:ubiquinone/menaquinone biosynthesis C-methylase UbiE
MVHLRLASFLAVVSLSACASGPGTTSQDASVAPGINERYGTTAGRATSVQILESADRDHYQRPELIIEALGLREGDVVCEVGAGTGYFTPFLSKAVGAAGRVYAEDPQPEFLELLRQKKAQQGLSNVETVLGTYTDTNLPDLLCDLTFVLDAYHHFEWPRPMLEAMKGDTKPDGRLVIVDFYRRQNHVFDRWGIDAMKHVRLDVDAVVEEVSAHGWRHEETRRFLELQYFAVFTPK